MRDIKSRRKVAASRSKGRQGVEVEQLPRGKVMCEVELRSTEYGATEYLDVTLDNVRLPSHEGLPKSRGRREKEEEEKRRRREEASLGVAGNEWLKAPEAESEAEAEAEAEARQ